MSLVHLQIRNSKEDETPIEAATQIFSSLLPSSVSPWIALFSTPSTYSFELYLISQRIYFYVTTASKNEAFVVSLITSSFPNSKTVKTKDPFDYITNAKYLALGDMKLSSDFYFPTKTYQDYQDIDLMSSVLGFLAKGSADLRAAVQILISPATFSWQGQAATLANSSTYDEKAEKFNPNSQRMLILRKTAFQGGKVVIRLLAGSDLEGASLPYLKNLAGTFGAFSLGEGNQFKLRRPLFFKETLYNRMINRSTSFLEHRQQILNSAELATIWHPPGILLAGVKNIAWGKTLSGEPPEKIPIADNVTVEEKKEINFFAKTEFKNNEHIFGIRTPDRRKHVYIIGKTGAGKSTLIANMAIDDIRRDRGIGIIDPHGDLTEAIMDYIPKRRINDVVYLEPFDTERPFRLNILEVHNKEQKHLVASGIVSIFFKLYGNSWGPRLEYILRNVVLTLLEIPNAILGDALKLMANEHYRNKVLEKVSDPIILAFWKSEFAKMPDRLKAEAVSPIQNKIGQFVTSPMVRNIIGHPVSTINLSEIMDEGKILLLNLSQGKLGEDNASLLGAMIITQVQLAAMGRSFTKESERRDFFLYVDEFQNFATNSFIKILSEARKYRLSLTLANQYIEQLDEDVSKAIFGNVGTLISFVVGARDARPLSLEFGEIYTEKDLVSLGKFETVLKLSVDGQTSEPFPATTLPPPSNKNDNREKIIKLSKEKYGRKNIQHSISSPSGPGGDSGDDLEPDDDGLNVESKQPQPLKAEDTKEPRAQTPTPKAEKKEEKTYTDIQLPKKEDAQRPPHHQPKNEAGGAPGAQGSSKKHRRKRR